MRRLFGAKGGGDAPVGPPPQQVQATVIQDFDPAQAAGGDAFAAMRGGIALRRGQTVTVQADDNPNSWYVRTDRGAQGFVPSAVLQVIEPVAPPGMGDMDCAAAVPPPPLAGGGASSYETGIEAQMDALWEGGSADGSSGDGAGSMRHDSHGAAGSFGSGGFGPGAPPGMGGLSLRDSLRSSLASNASDRLESFSDRAGSMASMSDADGYRFGSIEESPTRGMRGLGSSNDPPAGPRAASGGTTWADADVIAPPSRSSPEHDPWAGQPDPPARRRGGGGGGGGDEFGGGGFGAPPPPVSAASSRRGPSGRGMEAGVVVVLDWDCTITTNHMHKDTGKRDASQGGMHSQHMEEWCQRNGVDSSRSRAGLSSVDRLDFGADTERVVVDYFFGGSERVAQLTAFFEWIRAQGCTLCVLTNGETAAVRQLFEAGFAPWAALFAGGWIANTYDEFFCTEEDGRVGEWPQDDPLLSGPFWSVLLG